MKKVIIVFALLFSISLVVTSCKGEKEDHSEENKEMHEEHGADKADIAMNAEYQCPMDCEEGKTYDAAGACPVCAMDLKMLEKEGQHTHEDGETHEDHEEGEEHQEEGHDEDHK